MEKTYEDLVAQACDDLVGSIAMGDEVGDHLRDALDREPTDEDRVAAEKYMMEAGIQECASCGWYQNENEGLSGDLCSDCAEEAENDDEDF